MNALTKQGLNHTISPFVIVTSDGNITTIKESTGSISKDEELLRNEAKKFGGVLLIIGGAINGKTIKEFMPKNSYSTAMQIGGNSKSDKPLLHTFESAGLKHIASLKATVKDITDDDKGGFLFREMHLETQENKYLLSVQNGYMLLKTTSGELIANFPDMITVVDSETNIGLNSGQVKVGQSVNLQAFKGLDYWYK